MKHYKNEEKRINAEMRKTEADHKNEKIKVNKLEAEVKRKQVNLRLSIFSLPFEKEIFFILM